MRRQAGLFEDTAYRRRPLADQMRPAMLGDVVGQDHVLGLDGPLERMLRRGRLASLILWGPPGSGKTTIARLLAEVLEIGLERCRSRVHPCVPLSFPTVLVPMPPIPVKFRSFHGLFHL